jgi:hypothetical protein
VETAQVEITGIEAAGTGSIPGAFIIAIPERCFSVPPGIFSNT